MLRQPVFYLYSVVFTTLMSNAISKYFSMYSVMDVGTPIFGELLFQYHRTDCCHQKQCI